MDCAKVGGLIRTLRTEKKLTQLGLAAQLGISDKAVSKWERGHGCPDVSLLAQLSAILEVSTDELLSGELSPSQLVGGNMKKANYYVCATCGSLTMSTGNVALSCCGRTLEALTAHKATEDERLCVEQVEDEWFISSSHPMDKDNYIAFVAFATGGKLQITKQYPEWNLQLRLPRREHGTLLWYSTTGGLMYQLL